MEPAAHTTTSRGSDNVLASPMTWLWFRALPSSSTRYAAVTVSSHSVGEFGCARAVVVADRVVADSASESASSASRASATTLRPPCFTASNEATLMLTNRTSGLLNAVRDALVKSL